MPQVLQQALQKLAAFKPAGSLRVTHVRAEVPVCPQHRAGAGLLQPCLPRCGPHMGRQRQPCGWLALICGLCCGLCCGMCCALSGGLICGPPGVTAWPVRGLRLGLGRILRARLRTALLPGLAVAGLRLRLPRMCLRRVRMCGTCLSRPPGSGRRHRTLRCGKGVVAIGHEQAGKPPALPERADRVYERKSHEHSSQATSALLWLGQISSCPVASTTAMELVAVPKPLSVALTRLAASTSAFLP